MSPLDIVKRGAQFNMLHPKLQVFLRMEIFDVYKISCFVLCTLFLNANLWKRLHIKLINFVESINSFHKSFRNTNRTSSGGRGCTYLPCNTA